MRAFRGILVMALAAAPSLPVAADQRPGVATPPVVTTAQSQDVIEARRLADQLKLYADQGRLTEFRQLLERAADDVKARQRAALARSAPPPVDSPLRIGGSVGAPLKIKHVDPQYPAVARAAGVQGRVILEIVVNELGDVTKATVLRSVPMLDQAALDAVVQWKYRPTQFNGQPVSLVMTVTVDFANKDGI
jgi:protein TonB